MPVSRSALIGHGGVLWDKDPALALVLATSWPSDASDFVRLRTLISSTVRFTLHVAALPVFRPVEVRHVDAFDNAYSCTFVYIGRGRTDCQSRPSIFSNPFSALLPQSPVLALSLYSEYVESRPDLVEFVTSLNGKTLICDCDFPHLCHGYKLIDILRRTVACAAPALHPGITPGAGVTNSLNCDADFVETAAAAGIGDLDQFAVSDDFEFDSDDEFGDIDKFKDFRAVNESERGLELDRYRERPSWCPAWVRLVRVMRSSPSPCSGIFSRAPPALRGTSLVPVGRVGHRLTSCFVPTLTVLIPRSLRCLLVSCGNDGFGWPIWARLVALSQWRLTGFRHTL